jgi:integrating conjugative element membrane protein (TIGR03745 family)
MRYLLPVSLAYPGLRRDIVRVSVLALLVFGALWDMGGVWAQALPTAPTVPGGASGDTDIIGTFQGFAGSAIGVVILVVAAMVFVVVGWLMIEALINAVSGRGAWGSFFLVGIAGSAAIVFILVLLNQANTIFGTS